MTCEAQKWLVYVKSSLYECEVVRRHHGQGIEMHQSEIDNVKKFFLRACFWICCFLRRRSASLRIGDAQECFKMFRYSFLEGIPIFFNLLKSFFSLSDRYKIFTSNWLWIWISENVVLGKIDVTMTTVNKKFEIDKRLILSDLDELLKIQH